jgi:hypothetical protein
MAATFSARVLESGLLIMADPFGWDRAVKELAGKEVVVALRTRKEKRSTQANKFYWGHVVAEIAEHCGYTKDEAHEALKFKFLKEDGDGPLVKVRSSASLSVPEFSEYVERVMAFGAETFGIVWMDPSQWEAA